MKPTKTTVVIEVAVEVEGVYARAEPDVGIMQSFFEDVEGTILPGDMKSAMEDSADQIQDALREADAENQYHHEADADNYTRRKAI